MGSAWFRFVVEAGSFARAGEALGLTQPAVSRAVARLEQRIGIRIFNRTARSISLTDEGRRYYEAVAPLIAGIEDATLSAGRAKALVRGRLRVNVDGAFGISCSRNGSGRSWISIRIWPSTWRCATLWAISSGMVSMSPSVSDIRALQPQSGAFAGDARADVRVRKLYRPLRSAVSPARSGEWPPVRSSARSLDGTSHTNGSSAGEARPSRSGERAPHGP